MVSSLSSAESPEGRREPHEPVQVLMPAGILDRLPRVLATIGLRLYRLPTKDGPTLMIAADIAEFLDREPDAQPTLDEVTTAWSMAVDQCADAADAAARRPKARRSTKRSTKGAA